MFEQNQNKDPGKDQGKKPEDNGKNPNSISIGSTGLLPLHLLQSRYSVPAATC
jgi:hypothetical protein